MNNPKFSETISSFIAAMDDAVKDYEWNSNQVNVMDRLTQDYLHALELDAKNYKERARIATRLADCRQKRRDHKDLAQAIKPLATYLASEKGREMMNSIRQTLDKTRKVESYLEHRSYIPRVLEMKSTDTERSEGR
jgi:phage shock protein A